MRNVLSKIASLFDPLGFISPIVIRAKITMQDIWASGLSLDEPLSNEIENKVKYWLADLDELSKIKVERCLQPINDGRVALHVFVDTSEDAYAAVVYLCCKKDDTCTIRLVASKTKVAPLKTMSIPRLELMATVLGLKLVKSIANFLDYDLKNAIFWSDSMTAICWIRGRSRAFKTFVANRVGYIQEHTNPNQWRHVPTKLNPTDVASRGTVCKA
ncbi:uncharacterized protein LOC117112338 [Anneissia japonica]|uniref:uncharacterized protein LOC117112338 n=1 Tax=Anneissia japonica TaxID=1529436 RepID=UPI001425A61C|nr:uncharacterized protein LOC117112338 [Anneissia japonica]